MKICLVNNLYGENARGGAERVVEVEAEALAAAGHEVRIVAGWGGAAMAAESVSAAGVRLRRVRPPNLYFYSDLARHGWLSRFFWHLYDTLSAAIADAAFEAVRRPKPEVVHTHNLMGLGFRLPARLRRLKVRHIHTVHDVQLLHPSGLLAATADPAAVRLTPLASIYVRLMRRLLGSPDVVIFPSKFLRDLHERFGFFPRSVKVILPNPAPVAAAQAAPAQPTFLFVGQLESHKGLHLLLDAWEAWPQRATARLEIVGAGSLGPELRRRAEALGGNVKLFGWLIGQELADAYGRAAYLVLPSQVIENAPAVVTEAMSRGIPVIASATGGVPELVSDGENGWLFTPGDRDGLTATLDKALAAWSADERPKLSTKALDIARRFSAEQHFTRLSEAYGRSE